MIKKQQKSGTRGSLKEHVLAKHMTATIIIEGKHTVLTNQYNLTKSYKQHILAHGELFYEIMEVKGKIWHDTLFFIGHKEASRKFRYIISLKDAENSTSVIFSSTVACFGEKLSDIYNNCRSVHIPYDVIKRCFDDIGNLTHEIEIQRDF